MNTRGVCTEGMFLCLAHAGQATNVKGATGAKLFRRLVVAVAFLVPSHQAWAAPTLQVQNLFGMTPRDLALFITGCGITIADVRYVGVNDSAGTFTTTLTGIIGFTDGLILSSGSINNILGPNSADNTSASNGTPGDPELQALIPGYTTHDATILEFDFIPSTTVVSFDYVFASEEYNEYANTPFNDVFAFFLNGKNVALLPGTSTPVSINNVNGGNPLGNDPQNSIYYIDNAIGSATVMDPSAILRFNALELDGLTVVMTVTVTVIPNEINRMRFAIADAGDSIFDSVVFIRAGSFGSKCSPPAPPPSSTVLTISIPASVHGYPNPFRSSGGGAFDCPGGMTLRSVPPFGLVRIYNAAGEPVAVLTDSDGDGKICWNIKNASGKAVESGVYFLVAKAKNGALTRGKIVIIR